MKTIQYETYVERENQIQTMQDQGVVIIPRDHKLKTAVGKVLIVFGALTLPFPTGSIPAIVLGCFFIGINKDTIKSRIKLKLKYEVNKRR